MQLNIEAAFAKWWFLNAESGSRRRLWIKLAKLMSNGVPIVQGLESMLARRAAAKGKSDPQCIAMREWIYGLKNGRRLSQMLEGWVTPVERMLISAGETTGTLEKSLIAGTRVMEAQSEIRTAVFAGLAYPVILICVAFAVMYMFGVRVVPEFTKIVPPDRFTGMAKFLVNMSDFAKSYLLFTAAGVVGAVVVFFMSLGRWDGKVRVFLDRYAPYSVYRVVVGSTWLIGLSSMLEAGVRLETALRELAGLADPWLKRRINAAIRGMSSGLNLGDSLNRSGYEFPDREIIDDLGVYSSLSGFDEALKTVGREWLTESVAQIKTKMNIVFGACLLSVALLVASMVGGMMTMQMQMTTAIQQHR
ncbi:type II secretion system F family protein [Azonexus hydrophilus]|uniref:Type II secretion system F family protein n=1 Tax=Azonexus hydrophilus TaxID=418702 RepID=A0ABZ2XM47_9RHOO